MAEMTTYIIETLPGDVTAVVSLLCDNLVNLITMQDILVEAGASESFVTSHIFLSSLIGVIFGNFCIFILSWFVFKSRLKAAIPFGIDAPTVFFIGYAVKDIYVSEISKGASSHDALNTAWGNGSLYVLIIGLIKLGLTSIYFLVWRFAKFDIITELFDKRIFGACLFGIGLSLLGMNSLIGVFKVPVAGIPALFVFFMVTLPYGINTYNYPKGKHRIVMTDIFKYSPHIFWSLLVGIPLYYILLLFPDDINTGAIQPEFFNGLPNLNLAGHFVCTDCKSNVLGSVTYAVLVFFGGYSVVNQSLAEADEIEGNQQITQQYNSLHNQEQDEVTVVAEKKITVVPESDRNFIFIMLFVDAISTIFTGLSGGLVQTTPYIGYSTYRELGAGLNYSIYVAGLFLLLAATGLMSYCAVAIPESVLKPIFILIAINLAQGIFNTVRESKSLESIQHNQAIPGYIMAAFPAMANLLVINGNSNVIVVTLASGFVWTSMLWGQATLSIIRGEKLKSCIVFFILGFITWFGIIHSWDGEVYGDPWYQKSYLPSSIMAGYFITGLLGFVFIPDVPLDKDTV